MAHRDWLSATPSCSQSSAAINGILNKAANPWAQSTQATLQQLAVEALDLKVAISCVKALELRVAPLRRDQQASLDRYKTLFTQRDLQMVEISATVVALVFPLLADHGLQ